MPCSESHQGHSCLACNAISVHARAARVAVRVQRVFTFPYVKRGNRWWWRREGVGTRCRGSETQPGSPISIYLLIRRQLQHSTAGPIQVKEMHLRSITLMDKQCRVLTSANKNQSCRSCLHTPAPVIDLQASKYWLAAMHSLDHCY